MIYPPNTGCPALGVHIILLAVGLVLLVVLLRRRLLGAALLLLSAAGKAIAARIYGKQL